MIPEEIAQKIDDILKIERPVDREYLNRHYLERGYKLALPEIQALKDEVRILKDEIYKLRG